MAPDGPPPRANPARGIALIATAVILGLFVLRQGLPVPASVADAPTQEQSGESGQGQQAGGGDGDRSGDPEGGSGNGGGGDGGGDGDGAGGGDGGGPDEQPVRPPEELTVQVANTTQVAQAAATWTERIGQNNYSTTEARQAAGGALEATVVMFRSDHQREAEELARAIGVPPEAAVPLDTQNPPVDRDNQPLMAEGTQLLVLLGPDLAQDT